MQTDIAANGTLDPLILDLLEWIAREPRSHAELIEAWRTSCPRLTVWEDAVDRGFAAREHHSGREVMIRLTAAGRDFLRVQGRFAGEDQSRSDAGRAQVSPGSILAENLRHRSRRQRLVNDTPHRSPHSFRCHRFSRFHLTKITTAPARVAGVKWGRI